MSLFETAKNCNLGQAIYGKPQASLENREVFSFIEEKGELGGAVINKESIGGNWEFEV